jgi:pimeloyl-ACP methyl ester carboxylesterase
MADFVLVHGAWLGAWCWKRVLPGLWSGGHRAYPVSLTGVGERAHQMSPSIGLATHIDDVAAVIEAEELSRVILVGHSYAGLLITAVADRMAERIGHLVYLDAVVARSGESWSSFHDEVTRKSRRDGIARTGAMPPPDPAVFGLSGADAEWVGRRQRPHPGGMYEELLQFEEARVAALPRTFVDCNQPALPSVAPSRVRVRSEPGWRVIELVTGHMPMVSEPRRLLEVLHEAAAGSS